MDKTMNAALLKFLQLAILADAEYEQAQIAGKSSLLAPNNFQNAILAVAQIFAPASTPAPVAPAASVPVAPV